MPEHTIKNMNASYPTRDSLRLAIAGVLCAVAVAPAAEPNVKLSLAAQSAYVNEALTVEVEVGGFEECEPPVWPDMPTCAVRATGQPMESKQVYITNNRQQVWRSRTYAFELTPTEVGVLTIPPVSVKVDGAVLKTDAVRIRVLPNNADELFAVEITVGRERLYVGQKARARMTIWVKPARHNGQMLPASYMMRRINPINFGPFPLELSNSHNVGRERIVDGAKDTYYAFDFVTEFIADRPGALTFDEIEVGIAYPQPNRTRNLRARPTVEDVQVLPVPMEGRPATFAGAVGLLDIETRAEPTRVRVGDPIELTIDVFGEGPVATLPPPLLAAHPALEAQFRIPDHAPAGQYTEGRRRFTVTIRARHDQVREIPAIEYPYFDPDAERFITPASDPIPLQVEPAAEIATPDLTPDENAGNAGNGTALEALDGLHGIETRETVLLAQVKPVSPVLVRTVMAGPPVAFGLLWAATTLVQRRSADPVRRRRGAALRRASRRVAAVRHHPPRERGAEIEAALAGYLADRLGEPPARFTGTTAVAHLRERGVNPDVVERCARVIGQCEQMTFGGGSEDEGDRLSDDAIACLRALERERL